MKRVLFLAYLFPPILNSGTQRPLKFAKYLPNYGWEPTVITAARFNGSHTDAGLLDELAPNQKIIRVPMLNERVADLVSAVTLGSGIGRKISEAVDWRLRNRFQNPDVYALWKPTALRAALKLYRQEGFDAIYATGFPWSTLLIGRDVAKATGRPLVADFRDLWAGEELWRSPYVSPGQEWALEQSVVEQAAAVVSVSTNMTRRMQSAHRMADHSKFVTIHNGFDSLDLTPSWPKGTKFRIVYTGVWKDGYNPARLYDAVESVLKSDPVVLQNTEVIMAGFSPGEARRRNLTSHIEEVGRLSHKDAVGLMRSADMLFFASADGAYQQLGVPGKMYEYLAAGQPVLAVTDPDGESGRILKRVGGGVAVSPADPAALQLVISHACRAGKLTVPTLNRQALSAFERPNLAKRLAAVLDALKRGAPPPPDDAWLAGESAVDAAV